MPFTPPKPETDTAILRIRNNTVDDYVVEELAGYVLAPNADVDLLDAGLPQHYTSYADVQELINNCPTAKLNQDIKNGKILIIEDVPPELPIMDF